MAPDIKNTATTLTDSESQKIGSEVKSAEDEIKADCWGCKSVAFTTPLLVSAYLIHQHSSIDKVAAMPIAKTWTGSRQWRLKFHRYSMIFAVPLCICCSTYGYMFNYGGSRNSAADQRPSQLVNDAIQRSDNFSKADSFTRGTLRVADWLTGKNSIDKMKHNSDSSGNRKDES